jgi:methyl-accepting chemotaxis protein
MSRAVTEAAADSSEIAEKVSAAVESVEATATGIVEARQAAAQLAQMSTDMQQTVDSFRR